jgi:nitric oxide dioxygenase
MPRATAGNGRAVKCGALQWPHADGALSTVVSGLKNLDAIVPIAQQLAVRHVSYGVKEEYYQPVGEALLWTLEKGLGPDFTPPVKQAWTQAYTTLSGVMIAAAYPQKTA